MRLTKLTAIIQITLTSAASNLQRMKLTYITTKKLMLSSPMMTMEATDQVITCMMGLLTMRTMLDITHYLIELERSEPLREDLTDQVMLSQDTDISVDQLEEEET